MSSKVLTGDAAKAAKPIAWTKSAPSVQPLVRSRPISAGQAYPSVSPAEVTQQLAQARQAGRAEGEQAARAQFSAQLESGVARIAKTISELAAYKPSLRREAEEDVVKLAIAIARRVLNREITVDQDALLGIVKAALDKIDVREIHRVRVCPAQLLPLRRAFETMGNPRHVEISPDPALEPGALVFESARGVMDASIETQLREIERGLTEFARRHQ